MQGRVTRLRKTVRIQPILRYVLFWFSPQFYVTSLNSKTGARLDEIGDYGNWDVSQVHVNLNLQETVYVVDSDPFEIRKVRCCFLAIDGHIDL